MKNAQTINGDLVCKTLHILDSVDGEKDLKKLKLTPLEYETAKSLLLEYYDNGEATTFLCNCANFFKKQGFIVKLTDDRIGWIIGSE